MQHEQSARRKPIATPLTLLLATLAIALGLGLTPRRTTQPLRDGWRELLSPSQRLLSVVADWWHERWLAFQDRDSLQAAKTGQQIVSLRAKVRQLETQLLLAGSALADSAPSTDQESADSQPLLRSQSIVARVLGRQAKMFLHSRDLLDVGRTKGVAADALVVDAPFAFQAVTLLDQGRNADLRMGRLVLAGSRIWGKVADVGLNTSTVLRVTQFGYRDLVQLASPRDGRLHFTARGVLVGRDRPQCEIELVETTMPVSVGDLVFAADGGLVDEPLLYGRVTRLERKPAAAHWSIWMEPAVSDSSPPDRVAVLSLDLNPARLTAAVTGK